jgi:hypothetical protein
MYGRLSGPDSGRMIFGLARSHAGPSSPDSQKLVTEPWETRTVREFRCGPDSMVTR